MKKVASEYKAFLESANMFIAARKQSGIEITPELARVGINAFKQFSLPNVDVKNILDSNINYSDRNVPVRIYDPAPDQTKPIIIFIHGGGHMCGNIDAYDPIGRRLADTSKHLVITIDYSLSPEFRYPQGLNDCQAMLDQLDTLIQNFKVDMHSISLAGDSAGGALATTLALNNEAINFSKLILIYPSLDYTFSTSSYETFSSGYLLETERVSWYFDNYFESNADRKNASPLFSSKLSRLPETLILAAELDPLVDEGKLFHDNLISANVKTDYHEGKGLIHCYLNLEVLNPTIIEHTYQTIAEFLNK